MSAVFIEAMIDSLSSMKAMLVHYECPQNMWELNQMLDIVRGKTSLLEIGSNFGGTLKRMAAVLEPKSLVVSVDYPMDGTPPFLHPVESLQANCQRIAENGHQMKLFMADSHDAECVAQVRELGPFDFCFIDGDHSYEGVKQDWENYGPMAKIVGFHDIGGPTEGCTRFWKELRAANGYRMEEFIAPESAGPRFGIGIVYREPQ